MVLYGRKLLLQLLRSHVCLCKKLLFLKKKIPQNAYKLSCLPNIEAQLNIQFQTAGEFEITIFNNNNNNNFTTFKQKI